MNVLWELSERYARETEEYDRTVCTSMKDGLAIPETGKQLALIGQHAQALNDRFLATLMSLGYTRSDWLHARSYAIRQFERQLKGDANGN
jgi:hypothetical protein